MTVEIRDLEGPTRASEEAVERVKRRLEHVPLGPPPGPRLPRWLGPAALGGGVLLAAALWWSTPTLLPVGPLESTVVAGGLTFEPAGRGSLEGTLAEPVVRWESGELQARADRDLTLHTRELHAVGQGDVLLSRSAAGTTLSVRGGSVRVDCLADADGTLEAGAQILCRPVSADSSLARLRRLEPTARLGEIDRALGLVEGTEAARAELGVLRISTLLESGRRPEALSAARDWLAAGGTLRRPEVLRLAAGLALELEGCAGSLELLTELAPHDSEARVALTACDPEENR